VYRHSFGYRYGLGIGPVYVVCVETFRPSRLIPLAPNRHRNVGWNHQVNDKSAAGIKIGRDDHRSNDSGKPKNLEDRWDQVYWWLRSMVAVNIETNSPCWNIFFFLMENDTCNFLGGSNHIKTFVGQNLKGRSWHFDTHGDASPFPCVRFDRLIC